MPVTVIYVSMKGFQDRQLNICRYACVILCITEQDRNVIKEQKLKAPKPQHQVPMHIKFCIETLSSTSLQNHFMYETWWLVKTRRYMAAEEETNLWYQVLGGPNKRRIPATQGIWLVKCARLRRWNYGCRLRKIWKMSRTITDWSCNLDKLP